MTILLTLPVGNFVPLSSRGSGLTALENPKGVSKLCCIEGRLLLRTHHRSGCSIASANGCRPMDRFAVNTCFAVSGTTIFASDIDYSGLAGGLYRSTNNGVGWTNISAGLSRPRVEALTSSGTNLFAGIADSIFLSSDMGGTWAPINNDFPRPSSVTALASSNVNILANQHPHYKVAVMFAPRT